MNNPFQVIYLTGPPATGKSTLVSYLETRVKPLLSFMYSKGLAAHVSALAPGPLTQDMRRKSAQVIRSEAVVAVDSQFVRFVEENRTESHMVIGSHAVTKESFGFRVTPFGVDKLAAVNYSVQLGCPSTSLTAVCRLRNWRGRSSAA